jgi:hypothetical protein
MLPENADDYGVRAEKAQALVKYALLISGDPSSMNNAVLEGDHAEQAVIVVSGSKRTIDTFDPQTGFQAFVYNAPVYEAYVREQLVPALNKADSKQIDPDQWMVTHNQHLAKTLSLLAMDKPIYNIDVDNPTPQISYAGRVGQPTS